MPSWGHPRLAENANAPDWPAEREDRLRKMLAEGRSYTQIGHALGLSRCAVSGKVSRLRARLKDQTVAPGRPAAPRRFSFEGGQ